MRAEPMTDHLLDDALDDLLLDAGTEVDAAHVASCEACAARLGAFRSAMGVFNQATSAWSAAKSNSISREMPTRRPGFAILPAWSVAAAFFLAIALTFLMGIHRGMTPRDEARSNPAQIDVGDRQQEIASDNEMLRAIHTAISQPVPSPVEVYGIRKIGAASARGSDLGEVRN